MCACCATDKKTQNLIWFWVCGAKRENREGSGKELGCRKKIDQGSKAAGSSLHRRRRDQGWTIRGCHHELIKAARLLGKPNSSFFFNLLIMPSLIHYSDLGCDCYVKTILGDQNISNM